MMDRILEAVQGWPHNLLWAVGLTLLFGTLSRLTPCNPGQPFIPRDLPTDLLYWLIIPIFTQFIQLSFLATGAYVIFYGESPEHIKDYFENGFGFAATLPLWLQAAIVFIVSDFILYWTHRWFHGKDMWPYHAIHHAPEQVDWSTTFRFHPINIWLSFTAVNSFMLLMGFSPQSIGIMTVFNLLYSSMVHSNLNWTFGPFKYIFASPVFHRWHHTSQAEGMDKNFAPTFPLLDIMFGTFYMPEGKLPQHYGLPDAPKDFFSQLAWPFKRK